MDTDAFARQFGQLYRELFRRAARQIDDARERMAPETVALLLHMAQTGPATLSELVVHLGRSPSTLSVKIAALEASGLLARQRDEQDARRALIWLSPAGRVALTEALDVLDVARLAEATKDWDAARRQHLVIEMQALVHALSQTSSLIPPPPGEHHS
jgi:DNA-binding MarR family transcriptional regulator